MEKCSSSKVQVQKGYSQLVELLNDRQLKIEVKVGKIKQYVCLNKVLIQETNASYVTSTNSML